MSNREDKEPREKISWNPLYTVVYGCNKALSARGKMKLLYGRDTGHGRRLRGIRMGGTEKGRISFITVIKHKNGGLYLRKPMQR